MNRHFVSRRRAVAVVATFVLVALSAGATSVLANGGFHGRGDVPVPRARASATTHGASVIVGRSLKNDVSPPLRVMPPKAFGRQPVERESNPNPRPVVSHRPYRPDGARQTRSFAPNMPATTL